MAMYAPHLPLDMTQKQTPTSSNSGPMIPPTTLPNDPQALTKYIQTRHLELLRQVFELHTVSNAERHGADHDERAARRRAERTSRRASPTTSHAGPTTREPTGEDARIRRKLGLDEQARTLPKFDRVGHSYDFVYDLAPGGSADEYYHGPHPPPPARVVRAVLRASKQPPFFDPEGLSAEQLEAAANTLWASEGRITGNAEQDEAWEQDMIASFSATCAERLGRGLMELPLDERPPLESLVPPPIAPPAPPAVAQPQSMTQPYGGPQAVAGAPPGVPPPPPQAQPGPGPQPVMAGAGPGPVAPMQPGDPYGAMYNPNAYWKYCQPGPNRPSGAAINQLTARKSTAAESHCLNSFVPPLKPPCRTAYRSQRGLQPPTMPTITVDRANFFEKLGRDYTANEFDELLFEYGLELDEDTTTDSQHPAGEPHQLKIEVPANRYDLLCGEGLVRALKLYLHPELGAPHYKLVPAPQGQERTVIVRSDTAKIRPYFASAVLRNVTFDKLSYASFIDLQDKLHSNLARKRTLVAIGTHDLDKIAPGDISYEALPPRNIRFVPLNKDKEYTAEELMILYKEDKHLSRYLHIIEGSPVYPVIYDTSRQVLSMPPIINSEGTKISLDTKNVFIDVTATDETKLQYVVDMIVTMFSEYCSEPFTVEPVKLVFEDSSKGGARTVMSPGLASRPFVARTSYINSCTGLSLSRDEVVSLLRKMGHDAFVPTADQRRTFVALNAQESLQIGDDDIVHVLVPPTRPDILHECDIMEDAAVAYGFNNLKRVFPPTNTVAKPFPPNKLSDILRRLCAEAGWTEVLPLILCSHDENFKFLNRPDPRNLAVVLANPKTVEYQIVRTSLLPGMLKSIRENRKHALPLKVFEVSDVVVKDPSVERQARNVRRLAAVFCGRRAGFEVVHGLLDRLMLGLGVKNLGSESSDGESGYYIKAFDDATYFPNRSAKIYYRPSKVADAPVQLAPVASADPSNASAVAPEAKENAQPETPTKSGPLDTLKDTLSSVLPGHHHRSSKKEGAAVSAFSRDIEIGQLGILHPTVLKSFELDYPCSSLEFDVEPFL